MGICFCSHRKVYPPSREDTQNPPPSREDCHPQNPPPSIEDSHPQNPPPSRPKKEIYYDLVTHLRESYDNADILQLNFATVVIQTPSTVEIAKSEVDKNLGQTALTNNEVEEIVNDIQQENNWLDKSKEKITNELSTLNDVYRQEHSFLDKQPYQVYYNRLIDKLKTDFLTLLDYRLNQSTKYSSCALKDGQSSDDSDTDRHSEKSDKESCNSLEQVSDNESNSCAENGDDGDIHDDRVRNFKLLYTCSLLLKTIEADFTKIYNKIPSTHV